MSQNKKYVCIIFALCFLINFFMIIPTFATQENSAQNGIPTPQTDNETPVLINPEIFSYNKKVPLKEEHQKLLWDYCIKRNIDYIDMLSLISTESNFEEKCESGIYKGYFQISKGNCENLSKYLKTSNSPMDGSININWGTSIYSGILKDKRVENLQGKKLRDAALSIYQRGTGGYDKYGISDRFLKAFYKKREIICSYFK